LLDPKSETPPPIGQVRLEIIFSGQQSGNLALGVL
jgi:hypothetical protein